MNMFPRQKQFAQVTLLRVHRKQPALLPGGTAKAAGASSSSPLSGREGVLPERPVAVVNTNTFGSGKTSVASFPTSFQIRPKRPCARWAPSKQPISGIYILPSVETILSFASAACQSYVTWLAASEKLLVFHLWCQHLRQPEPACTCTPRRRCGKSGTRTGSGSTWRSPPDIMILADCTSAREITARRDSFRDHEELNKWLVLPITDEYPAHGGLQHPAGQERDARRHHLRVSAAQEAALLVAHVGLAHGAADE